MLKNLLTQKYKIKGMTIKPNLIAPDLDIVKIENINTLVYPLTDASLNQYSACVEVGDKVLKGQVIANADNVHGLKILAALDGKVVNIEDVKAPLACKKAPAIIIEPENKNYLFEDVLYNTDLAIKDYPKEMIFEKIVQANIQGLGGGLFLTAKKIMAKNIKHLVLNAVECEPILNCDEALLNHYLAEVLFGGLLLQQATSAKTITIVVKQNKKELISHINHFIKNNPSFNNILLATVPDIYPSGAEKEIIKHVFHKKISPTEITSDFGFLVQNVMTAISVFRAVTCDLKQLERVFSVFGENIDSPKNILAPIGVTFEDICDFMQLAPSTITSVKTGGLMMGEKIDLSLNLKHTALQKNNNGIILNTEKNKKVFDCINCGDCIPVCPSSLLPNKMFKASLKDEFNNKYINDVELCIECGLCNHVCPSNIDLVGMFKFAKQQRKNIVKEHERAEYINKLTNKKAERLKEELAEKERIKQERKLAREQRLAAKKKAQEND